jgi:hypothetical protein
MCDLMRQARVSMAALVQSLGCFDAVAETINARWGASASKGTISKKMAGQLDWTMADVIALEDAAGRFPITRMLARRRAARSTAPGTLIQDGASIAKEAGEAIAAVLAAEQSSGADERAEAIKEVDEAIVALRAARARLEGAV